MRKLKKALAVLLSAAMVLGMSSMAFAEPEAANSGDRTADSTIMVQELAEGDVVTYYQVIEWVDSEGWAFKAPFKDKLDADDMKKITGTPAVPDDPDTQEDESAEAVPGKIDQELATKIAGAAADGTSGGTVSGTEWSKSDVAPGLYMVVIAAKESGVVYNPVFVAADFDANNGTNSLGISTASYSDAGIAKKKVITVDKTEKDANSAYAEAIDSYVGELVDFKIETTIPAYLPTYKNPTFVIKDKVKTGGIELLTGDDEINVTLNPAPADGVTAYEIKDKADDGFTIEFKEGYLKANQLPVEVTVDYQGRVTDAADFNVNQDKNTVDVTYSNGPGTEKGALRDVSNTYTFSLGAALLGNQQQKTSELVKVAVDQNGQYVVEEKELDNTKKVGALPGATFALATKADADKDEDYIATFTTGDDGILTFKGLSGGITYYLKEIDAPDGYIRDRDVHTIKIEATYTETVPEETEEEVEINGVKVKVKYKTQVLDSYTVKIDGEDFTSFTMTNEGPTTSKSTINRDSFEVKNTAGVELPATGGIGTTIFYILGSILVIGAGVILVARRRMGSIQE